MYAMILKVDKQLVTIMELRIVFDFDTVVVQF